jgi:hypothetical protein
VCGLNDFGSSFHPADDLASALDAPGVGVDCGAYFASFEQGPSRAPGIIDFVENDQAQVPFSVVRSNSDALHQHCSGHDAPRHALGCRTTNVTFGLSSTARVQRHSTTRADAITIRFAAGLGSGRETRMYAPANRPAPVTPELWERLRRFDPHCYISMGRTMPGTLWRDKAVRTWQVCIHPHERRSITDWAWGEHPNFAEALRAAIEQAEERGWAR